jgi:tyrosyl-tRNA synthetase
MWRWYTLLSFRSLAEIAALKAEVAAGATPRTPRCCWPEITTRFQRAPPRPPSRISPTAARAACPTRSRGALAGAPLGIGLVLKQAGLAPSTSEANRLIDGGGVRVDGSVVSDKGLKLAAGTYVVQVGKRKFARVTLA